MSFRYSPINSKKLLKKSIRRTNSFESSIDSNQLKENFARLHLNNLSLSSSSLIYPVCGNIHSNKIRSMSYCRHCTANFNHQSPTQPLPLTDFNGLIDNEKRHLLINNFACHNNNNDNTNDNDNDDDNYQQKIKTRLTLSGTITMMTLKIIKLIIFLNPFSLFLLCFIKLFNYLINNNNYNYNLACCDYQSSSTVADYLVSSSTSTANYFDLTNTTGINCSNLNPNFLHFNPHPTHHYYYDPLSTNTKTIINNNICDNYLIETNSNQFDHHQPTLSAINFSHYQPNQHHSIHCRYCSRAFLGNKILCSHQSKPIITTTGNQLNTGNYSTTVPLSSSSLLTGRDCQHCWNSSDHGQHQKHKISNYRRNVNDLSQLPAPSLLGSLVKPIVKNVLDWTHLTAIFNLAIMIRQQIRNFFRWCPTSSQELDDAESKVLSYLNCNYRNYYVDIGNCRDLDNIRIWTMEIEPDPINMKQNQKAKPDLICLEKNIDKPGLPLVLIHGFASGLGLWALNLDEFARRGNRKIFAFDVLGFAKSSRPKFSSIRTKGLTDIQRMKLEAEHIEEYFTTSIEKWRLSLGESLNDKFIILGHSFGAYLSLAYALRYPKHVAHIILADPWGIPPKNQSRHIETSGHINTKQLPWWAKMLGKVFLDILNPLSALRAIGPYGPSVLHSIRPDIRRKFERLTNCGHPIERLTVAEKADNPPPLDSDDEIDSVEINGVSKKIYKKRMEDKCDFINYIYHCNAQSRPSGEYAFKKLCTTTGWARLPMLERIHGLDLDITLSFIYGSRSWIDRQAGLQAKYVLATKNLSTMELMDDKDKQIERVDVHIINGAGHHVYADKPEEFNNLVLTICENIDYDYGTSLTNNSDDDNDYNDNVDLNQSCKSDLFRNRDNNQYFNWQYTRNGLSAVKDQHCNVNNANNIVTKKIGNRIQRKIGYNLTSNSILNDN